MKYRVRVAPARLGAWLVTCPADHHDPLRYASRALALEAAHRHAAACQALHWDNWRAACPSCRLYGVVAPACPICLGYGWERDREGLS